MFGIHTDGLDSGNDSTLIGTLVIYTSTDDPMEANGSLVTLHARFAGKKTVTLPMRTTVLDVFNRRIVAKDADTFSFDAPLHSSWLFYLGDDAEALAERLQKSP